MRARFVVALLAGCWLTQSAHAQIAVKSQVDSLGDLLPDGAVARLGTLRFKHDPAAATAIGTAVFSPDGKMLATTASGEGRVLLWEAATGKALPGPWSSDQGYLYTFAAFSPDGKILAAARIDYGRGINGGSGIMLWDVVNGKELGILSRRWSLSYQIGSLAFADGGKTLVSAANDGVCWWDVATCKEQRSWKPFGALAKVKGSAIDAGMSPSVSYVLSPGATSVAIQVMLGTFEGSDIQASDGETVVWDLVAGKEAWRVKGRATGTKVLRGGTVIYNNVTRNCVAFSAGGKRVALALDSDQCGTP